ncbi:MAG TPA: 16S rRNA (uracil(1498)-N(3))-methyltransferase, partial [Candidatus Hydrogenedentes bacterium]|nr:16S rRNA (uracil(1498)-N(3))-methyltransferase [Candidatus Hydrogenedentota bacterium]
ATTPWIELSGEEAHHAARVARLRPGDAVSVFDGAGLEAAGQIETVGRHAVAVRLLKTMRHAPPKVSVTLAVGGLHRERMQEEVVRHAAELGVHRVCFWSAEHSQRPVTLNARWRKTAIEACKQCGRFYLPLVDIAPSLDAFLENNAGPCIIGLLEKSQPDDAPVLTVTDRLTLLVGPEGDFSAGELARAFAAGAAPLSLGAYTYRSEVAATIMATLVAFKLEELGPGLELRLTRQ